MNIEETLFVIRNIFLKCFFIGFICLVIAIVIYMPCQCFVANFYQNGLGISQETYYNLWVGFVGLIKTILIFLFLVPAISIHWTAMACKAKHQPPDIEN